MSGVVALFSHPCLFSPCTNDPSESHTDWGDISSTSICEGWGLFLQCSLLLLLTNLHTDFKAECLFPAALSRDTTRPHVTYHGPSSRMGCRPLLPFIKTSPCPALLSAEQTQASLFSSFGFLCLSSGLGKCTDYLISTLTLLFFFMLMSFHLILFFSVCSFSLLEKSKFILCICPFLDFYTFKKPLWEGE